MAKKVFIVWNSTGLPLDRKALLEGWVKTYGIDVAVLVEGGSGAKYTAKGKEITLDAVTEKCECTAKFTLSETDAFEKNVKTLTGGGKFLPAGGKSTFKYYAITPGLTAVTDDSLCAYETDADVRDWILAPWKTAIEAEGTVMKGSKRRATVSVSEQDKETALSAFTGRLNMLGQRRPKAFEVDGLRVIMWHSPLGGETDPADADCFDLPGKASGGNDAKYCNWLFAKHLGGLGTKDLLVGDLNMDAIAVKAIYGSKPGITSADGWCHAVGGSGVTIKSLEAPGHVKDTMGDHSPIMFEATW